MPSLPYFVLLSIKSKSIVLFLSDNAIKDAIIAGSNAWIFIWEGLDAKDEPHRIKELKSLWQAPEIIIIFGNFECTNDTLSSKYLLFLYLLFFLLYASWPVITKTLGLCLLINLSIFFKYSFSLKTYP